MTSLVLSPILSPPPSLFVSCRLPFLHLFFESAQRDRRNKSPPTAIIQIALTKADSALMQLHGHTKETSDLSCATLEKITQEPLRRSYKSYHSTKARPTPLRMKCVDASLIECYFIDTPIFAYDWSSVVCKCTARKRVQKGRCVFFCISFSRCFL